MDVDVALPVIAFKTVDIGVRRGFTQAPRCHWSSNAARALPMLDKMRRIEEKYNSLHSGKDDIEHMSSALMDTFKE